MKKTIICWLGLLFLTLMTCIFNPPNNGGDDNPHDTIIGWERAGINSTGENSQHVDVCHYGGNLFTFNYRGELFYCIYPVFDWTKMSVPNGHLVYCIYCDTVNGLLYVSTIECGVYEYSISSEIWRSLVPKHDVWYDSTKFYQDSILSFHMYDVVCHNNMIYIMTIQRWTENSETKYNVSICRSNRDTLWEYSDSGWDLNNRYPPTITDFFSIDNYLYASTFENGLWRYDGISWMAVPGTRVGDVNDLIVNGGDPYSIPGFRPRSMVKHKNDIYVGNLGGMVHKMLPGFQWEKRSSFFLDYNANKIFDHWSKTMSLYSYNGYLVDATYYYSESDTLWLNMTPMFKAFDTTKNNALPGYVYGMTNIGDTLFVAVGDDNGKYSGVYFLDLKKCKWYQKYR